MKEKLKEKLDQYNIRFIESRNSLSVKLGLGQEIVISFKDGKRIELKEKLRGWNFLSGIMEVNMVKALILQSLYITLMAIVLFFVFQYVELEIIENFLIVSLISIFCWGYTILWAFYYHIKAENFKRTVINWLDD